MIEDLTDGMSVGMRPPSQLLFGQIGVARRHAVTGELPSVVESLHLIKVSCYRVLDVGYSVLGRNKRLDILKVKGFGMRLA